MTVLVLVLVLVLMAAGVGGVHGGHQNKDEPGNEDLNPAVKKQDAKEPLSDQ